MPEGGADMGGRGGSSHRQTAGGTAAIQTFLQNAYGANHANAVLAILQNAPAHIRALWEQYAAQFRATNMRRDEGALYLQRRKQGSGFHGPARWFYCAGRHDHR